MGTREGEKGRGCGARWKKWEGCKKVTAGGGPVTGLSFGFKADFGADPHPWPLSQRARGFDRRTNLRRKVVRLRRICPTKNHWRASRQWYIIEE